MVPPQWVTVPGPWSPPPLVQVAPVCWAPPTATEAIKLGPNIREFAEKLRESHAWPKEDVPTRPSAPKLTWSTRPSAEDSSESLYEQLATSLQMLVRIMMGASILIPLRPDSREYLECCVNLSERSE
ncbi:hypothetical protein PM082_024941 [Marasmius tenuissimus]|nr:hypothetical protein PM082_024941 [Marasmius tenuissimus]